MPAFFSSGASRTCMPGQFKTRVSLLTELQGLPACRVHAGDRSGCAHLLEGSDICEVVEADAQACNVLRQRRQLALNKLRLADTGTCSSTVTNKAPVKLLDLKARGLTGSAGYALCVSWVWKTA